MNLSDAAPALVTASATLAAAGYLVRSVRGPWRRVQAFLDDWNGEPSRPGRLAVPPMPERIAYLEAKVTSLHDDVTDQAGRLAVIESRSRRIRATDRPENSP